MKDKKRIERDITAIKTCITNYKADLAEAEKELTELEKPELKHGDYGLTERDCPRIELIHNNESWHVGETGNMDNARVSNHPADTILGNIFADLKALSEPLEEFELENGKHIAISGRWYDSGNLRIHQGTEFIVIAKKSIPEFILNLRRMQAGEKK